MEREREFRGLIMCVKINGSSTYCMGTKKNEPFRSLTREKEEYLVVPVLEKKATGIQKGKFHVLRP